MLKLISLYFFDKIIDKLSRKIFGYQSGHFLWLNSSNGDKISIDYVKIAGKYVWSNDSYLEVGSGEDHEAGEVAKEADSDNDVGHDGVSHPLDGLHQLRLLKVPHVLQGQVVVHHVQSEKVYRNHCENIVNSLKHFERIILFRFKALAGFLLLK